MFKELKYALKKKLKRTYMVQNINLDITKNQKKVLLAYINNSLIMDLGDISKITHTNTLEQAQILKVLINRGYCIDSCHLFDDLAMETIKNKHYDIIIGMGDNFRNACELNPNAEKIIYITEMEPKEAYRREVERLKYYEERHGKLYSTQRSGVYYKVEDFKNLDYGIALGDTDVFKDYDFEIKRIYPSGLKNKEFKFYKKDFKNIKNNFLWFGSHGAIHKGLDLLLDIFSKRDDINLHICGLSKEDRKRISIPNRKNIIDHGFVNVNSKEYLDIIDKCTFAILPSCAEAMSTAILTSMRQGLIPVVSKDLGFEVMGDLVYILEDYKLDYLNSYIDKLLTISEDELYDLSNKVYLRSNEEFSLEKFTERFTNMLMESL